MQAIIDRIDRGSRHPPAVSLLGLAGASVIYAVGFLTKLWSFAGNTFASLLVSCMGAMVLISSHGQPGVTAAPNGWRRRAHLGRELNPAAPGVGPRTDRELGWAMATHALFVVVAFALGILDRKEAAGTEPYPTISEPEKK